MYIEGNFIDVVKGEIYPARITYSKTIQKIQKVDREFSNYIAPGFIDSHIRFEDSFLSPVEYTKLALLSGVTSVVEDCSGFMTSVGADSIKYLITEFNKLPIDFWFLFPLNVEPSEFETGPKELKHTEFVNLLKNKHCLGLTQVDDVRKISETDSNFLKRINLAKEAEKPIISNIPKVHFTQLGSFAQMGIRADFGSNVYQEAFEKACFGLKIKIVEGTKRKTLSNLVRLAKQFDTSIVSEEKSVQELMKGYLSQTLKKAVSLGLDPMTAIKNVTVNPANLLGLSEGVLEEGKRANIVEIEDLKTFNVLRVIRDGEVLVKNGKLSALKKEVSKEPRFKIDLVDLDSEDLQIPSSKEKEKANVLVVDSEGKTSLEQVELKVEEGRIRSDPENDILKVVVASSYGENIISVGFVKGFGLTKGSLATSVGGSVGNIIAVGTCDDELALAINTLKENKGGLAAVDLKRFEVLSLPIYGTVCNQSPEDLVDSIKKLYQFSKRFGSNFGHDSFEVLGSLMNVNKEGFRLTDMGIYDSEKKDIINVLID